MKKLLALMLVMVLVMSMLAGCGNSDDENGAEDNGEETSDTGSDEAGSDFDDKVVFTVNDTKIMLSAANVLLYQIKGYYENTYGPDVWDMEASEGVSVEEYVKNDIKDLSIRTEILSQIASSKGFELSEDKKTELLAQATTIYASYSDEVKVKYGITEDIVKKLILEQGLSEVVFEEMTKDIELSEEEIETILKTNAEYENIMKIGTEEYYEQVRARHILVSTLDEEGQLLSEEDYAVAKTLIEDLRQRALDGEDFATLATEYTEDPGSKETGGEYTFGRGQMVPEFEEGAFGLEEGGISEVIETQYGFHIIMLEEKIPATEEQITGAEALLTNIEEEAKYRLKLEKFDAIYDALAAGYETTTVEEIWETMTFRDEEVTDEEVNTEE